MKKLHKSCLICDSGSLIDLKQYRKDYLCKCKSCGFVFSKRIPSEQELIDFYEKYSRDDYLSPVTVKRYNELLDQFEKYRKTNRIIDVGCGVGYFLEEAKKRKWEVYGTEYTNLAVEICEKKGIQMKQGKLNSNNYSPESFDIVTSFEVIEHIYNPKEELCQISELMRKGGLVYLTTPNFNSITRYWLKQTYDNICYPEHLSYYTPKTIKNLFMNRGFITKRIETTGVSITRLINKEAMLNQTIISATSEDEILRKNIEQKQYLRFLKKIMNYILTFLGIGDSLKGSFEKV